MIDSVSFIRSFKRILIDASLLAVIYYLPSLSHLFNYPIYCLEPMRIALFLSIIFLKDKKNAYLLALTLPLFSYFVVGHPVAIKNVILSIELVANVFILYKLIDNNFNLFASSIISIFISKLLYYILKYIAIIYGLLSVSLFDTPILTQAVVATLISLFFILVNQVKDK